MPDIITQALINAGPVGVIFIALGWGYAKGWLATGRELAQVKAELAFERQERIRERQEHVTDKLELRKEVGFWRNLAWSVSKVADQVAAALPVRSEST